MKTRKLLGFLVCVFCCLLLFLTEAPAESHNPYAPSYKTYDTTYDAIIRMYVRVFNAHSKGGSDGRHDLFNDNIEWEYAGSFDGEKDAVAKQFNYIKNHVGYAITDVNGDGIEELLIGSDKAYIYGLFTMDEGKVRELIRAGARYGCYLLKDGTFWRHGSSGAAYYGYYAFRMNGTKAVQFVKGYHFNGCTAYGYDLEDSWFRADSDMGLYDVTPEMHVTEDEAMKWIRQCEASLADIRFIPFAAYEQGIEGEAIGMLSYNGKTTGKEKINIRKKPAKNSKLVATKKVGTYVSVLDRDGDYYHIAFGKTTGYVHKDFLTLLTELKEDKTQ